jgi:thiamine biosynthesis protein ThiS
MPLILILNGASREFASLTETVQLAEVIAALELKGDRIAVELNGDIVQRTAWAGTPVATGDRLEVVHFVGGGSPARGSQIASGGTGGMREPRRATARR